MLDDREQRLLHEIEQGLLDDPHLRRLASRGPRLGRGLAVWALVVCVGFLVAAAAVLVVLGLLGQSLVVLVLAVWPALALRRRTGWSRRPRRAA
ncbi:DUF3040 domain-containing protein [Actinomycetospora lutea]|uniref:DUF3040 domain-containing protein n=1 Tax=Actinomycetospora lutea TaxID=663604 RepID=UPI0023670D0C|nr:DUF3040 domain-containing protein [Actinomycetospora lutea]MDD7942482.1 DUF3040 domain-containing protein [Actinomycetospora lutea]